MMLGTIHIDGPHSGAAHQMSVIVDNQPASIVTATPRSVFFSLPPNLPVGMHTLFFRDGRRTVSFPVATMALVMRADRLQLQRGESTNYSATLQIGGWPKSNAVSRHWGGYYPELTDLTNVRRLAPQLSLPRSGEPGVVFFSVENASRDVISMKPSENEAVTRILHQQDFQNGQFTISGVLQSNRTGGF